MKATHALIIAVVSTFLIGACQKADRTDQTVSASSATANTNLPPGSIPEAALSQVLLSYWEQESTVAPGGTIRIKIGLSNNSDYSLNVTSPPTYQIMATWHEPKMYALVDRPIYGPIAYSIPAKDRGAADLGITAPTTSGSYLLKIQLADGSGVGLEGIGVKALLYNIVVK